MELVPRLLADGSVLEGQPERLPLGMGRGLAQRTQDHDDDKELTMSKFSEENERIRAEALDLAIKAAPIVLRFRPELPSLLELADAIAEWIVEGPKATDEELARQLKRIQEAGP
jgi:hypothetical protein